MEQEKFRLKLNLFDGIVLLLAVAVAAFLLWRTVRPELPVSSDPSTTSTVRYTVRFKRCIPGSSHDIEVNDRVVDNIKNYEAGRVVSVEAVPAISQTLDIWNDRYVWMELEGFEDILVTIEAPCVVTDEAIAVGGGYELRVGSNAYLKGEGYMGSGPIVAIEEVRG